MLPFQTVSAVLYTQGKGMRRCHRGPLQERAGAGDHAIMNLNLGMVGGGQVDKAVPIGRKVAGSNPPSAGQLPHFAPLCWSWPPSGKLMYIVIS